MSRNLVLIGAVAAGALAVAGAWMLLRTGATSNEPREAAALAPSSARAEPEPRDVAREAEIERLRQENARLAELLSQQRELAAQRAAELEAEPTPDTVPEAAAPADTLTASLAILKRLMPERFGALTAEQLAALEVLDLHGSKA